MCIIITKEKNAAPLPEEIFDIIWTNNPDGGGILYHDGKKAVLKKGMMKRDEFLTAAKAVNKKGISYIMHTRIATHGSVKPENTHPFISKHLGFAHNGTFNIIPFPDKTDSETFFAATIADKKFKWCENNKLLLDMATNGCRCAIMDLESGKIMHLCEEDWKLDKKYKGYKFSNTGYIAATRYLYSSKTGTSYCGGGYNDRSYNWDNYDDYDDWDLDDKYGKIDKVEDKIIDHIKLEQFEKKKTGLTVDKDWVRTCLEGYCEKSKRDKKDLDNMCDTIKKMSVEYSDALAVEGEDSYAALSTGIILNFTAYASAKGYKNVKQIMGALEELTNCCVTETPEEENLIEEIRAQIEEWK